MQLGISNKGIEAEKKGTQKTSGLFIKEFSSPQKEMIFWIINPYTYFPEPFKNGKYSISIGLPYVLNQNKLTETKS